MSVPILTSDGVLSQRVIVDDYFKAGETLKAGDSVVIAQDPITPFLPRIYMVDDNGSAHQKGERAIGVVYAAPTDTVGTTVKANTGELVPVVVSGITEAICNAAVGVGDPVVGANTLGRLVATLTPTAGKMYGKALTNTASAGETFYVLVSLG